MPSRIAVAVIEVEPRALAEWAAARPDIVPHGWDCAGADAALELMRSNPAFGRRLAALYICAHAPAATPVESGQSRARSSQR